MQDQDTGLVYTQTMHLPFINTLIGHIYDFDSLFSSFALCCDYTRCRYEVLQHFHLDLKTPTTTTKKILQTISTFSSLTVYLFSLSHLAPGYATRSHHLRWMRFEKVNGNQRQSNRKLPSCAPCQGCCGAWSARTPPFLPEHQDTTGPPAEKQLSLLMMRGPL